MEFDLGLEKIWKFGTSLESHGIYWKVFEVMEFHYFLISLLSDYIYMYIDVNLCSYLTACVV